MIREPSECHKCCLCRCHRIGRKKKIKNCKIWKRSLSKNNINKNTLLSHKQQKTILIKKNPAAVAATATHSNVYYMVLKSDSKKLKLIPRNDQNKKVRLRLPQVSSNENIATGLTASTVTTPPITTTTTTTTIAAAAATTITKIFFGNFLSPIYSFNTFVLNTLSIIARFLANYLYKL